MHGSDGRYIAAHRHGECRGREREGGISVNGAKAQGTQPSTPLGGPKNKDGFNGLGGSGGSGSKGGDSGPTIRDHRNN